MKLISINVGKAKPIKLNKEQTLTGIFKEPINQAVKVSLLGLKGDTQADNKNHGGPDQAVYTYKTEDYDWWKEQGLLLDYASFGENLSIQGLTEIFIGDRLHIGDVILEVSAPRIPCNKLAIKMNDVGFVKRFRQAERPGFYSRVIQEGSLQIGDAITYIPGPQQTSVKEVFQLYYEKTPSTMRIEQALESPLASRTRQAFERKLSSLA